MKNLKTVSRSVMCLVLLGTLSTSLLMVGAEAGATRNPVHKATPPAPVFSREGKANRTPKVGPRVAKHGLRVCNLSAPSPGVMQRRRLRISQWKQSLLPYTTQTEARDIVSFWHQKTPEFFNTQTSPLSGLERSYVQRGRGSQLGIERWVCARVRKS